MYKLAMFTPINSHFMFLIYCAHIEKEEDTKKYILKYIKNMDNAEFIIKLATRQAVFPHLSQTFTLLTPIPFITIKKHAIQHAQYTMKMSIALTSVTDYLNRHHIQTLAFKGPTLAKSAYGSITSRQFSDIDILIHKYDRFKMYQSMLEGGYIPEINIKAHTKKTFFNTVNVLGFYHPVSKVYIEVHWELLSKNYAVSWEENLLWETTSTVTINHTSITTMHREQQLLYLSLHGCKHLFERLGWVCDIDRTLRTEETIQWEKLLKQAKTLGVTRMLLLSFSLSQTLLATPLPLKIEKQIHQDSMIEILTKDIITLQYSSVDNKHKKHHHFILLWKMRENKIDKLHFAYAAMFNPKFDDFKFIQLPNYLTFFYPLVRPFRLLLKYFK